MNVAARATGITTNAFRPRGASDPLSPRNRYLRLPATFTSPDGHFQKPVGYGDALWLGIFDSAYTRPGDYLVQHDGTWFIASQQRLMASLCVRTTRIVTVTRPAAQTNTGVGAYGGVTSSSVTSLLDNWPAATLMQSKETHALGSLPANGMAASWIVLLPAIDGVTLRTADLLADDLGRNGTVTATELSQFGWRLIVRQATT
jgi:hypothetical protein